MLTSCSVYHIWSLRHYKANSVNLLSCETTGKGTGLAESVGKEEPVELDSIQSILLLHLRLLLIWGKVTESLVNRI